MRRTSADWWVFAALVVVILATRLIWAIVVFGDVRCAVAECRIVK